MSAGRDLSCEPALTVGAPATADAGAKRLPALTAVVAVRDTDAPRVCERSFALGLLREKSAGMRLVGLLAAGIAGTLVYRLGRPPP